MRCRSRETTAWGGPLCAGIALCIPTAATFAQQGGEEPAPAEVIVLAAPADVAAAEALTTSIDRDVELQPARLVVAPDDAIPDETVRALCIAGARGVVHVLIVKNEGPGGDPPPPSRPARMHLRTRRCDDNSAAEAQFDVPRKRGPSSRKLAAVTTAWLRSVLRDDDDELDTEPAPEQFRARPAAPLAPVTTTPVAVEQLPAPAPPPPLPEPASERPSALIYLGGGLNAALDTWQPALDASVMLAIGGDWYAGVWGQFPRAYSFDHLSQPSTQPVAVEIHRYPIGAGAEYHMNLHRVTLRFGAGAAVEIVQAQASGAAEDARTDLNPGVTALAGATYSLWGPLVVGVTGQTIFGFIPPRYAFVATGSETTEETPADELNRYSYPVPWGSILIVVGAQFF